jgi:hypothetical protein
VLLREDSGGFRESPCCCLSARSCAALSRDQQRGFTAWGQHSFALWEVVGLQIKLRLAWLAWLA